MPVKTILISSLSGEEIDGRAAKVTITVASKPGSTFELDAAEEEIEHLIGAATERKRRGRRPKAA